MAVWGDGTAPRVPTIEDHIRRSGGPELLECGRRADGGLDPIRRGNRILVFPHSENMPSRRDKLCVRIPIACPIFGDLVGPERRVAPGDRSVLRAAMPEASIDEDHDLCSAKDDVRSP